MPKTALLIIDMQEALVVGAYRAADVLERVAALADRARAAGVPVVYVQHNHATFSALMKGARGWRIHPIIAPRAGDRTLEKTASDAFYATGLESLLRSLEVDTIAIAGMMTEYCVDATARSALSHDFDVLLLSDCHTTGDSTLPAEQIVAHHNAVLPNVVHPGRRVRLAASVEVTFTLTERP